MVDFGNLFVYDIIRNRFYRNENKMKGVFNCENKNRGVRSITKYRRDAVELIDVFLLQQFVKY